MRPDDIAWGLVSGKASAIILYSDIQKLVKIYSMKAPRLMGNAACC